MEVLSNSMNKLSVLILLIGFENLKTMLSNGFSCPLDGVIDKVRSSGLS